MLCSIVRLLCPFRVSRRRIVRRGILAAELPDRRPRPRFLDSFSGLDMTTPSPAPTSLMADAIRALSLDAVQKANSGHPGIPMGMAEIGVALWFRHLRHNPTNPPWANRDRFILSNGPGVKLLYSLLHLTGYDLPMEERKSFR